MTRRVTKTGGWRMWAICCEGVGPITGLVYCTKTQAHIVKRHQYADNDLYQVRRMQMLPDPEKRRSLNGRGSES